MQLSATMCNYLQPCATICNHVQPEGIDLLYWDTEVCAHEKYERGEYESIMSSTKPAGGGGTDATCVPLYMAEHSIKPECAVMLTDGYVGSNWGNWSVPVLWCIIDNKTANPSVGKTVHI